MVDTVHGKLRVRAWPKPRGPERSSVNRDWSAWLRAATYLYRYQPADVQAQFTAATKGTVWMPRDIFISAMRARAFQLQDQFGRKYYPMAMREDVSESLDAITQVPGSMLFRGDDLWMAIIPGTPGDALRYISDSDPPEWQPLPSGLFASLYVVTGHTATLTFNVNSTSYVTNVGLYTAVDYDRLPFTRFRIILAGQANAAGQTVTLELRDITAGNIKISAAGNDLVVTSTPSVQASAWIDVSSAPSGLSEIGLAMKGSNSTVDLVVNYAIIQVSD